MKSDTFQNQPKIHETRDGSTTLFSEAFNQHYHNPNGAVSESRMVFFEATGLLQAIDKNEELHIFETGFGTGQHLVMLQYFLKKRHSKCKTTLTSVEAFPVSRETAEKFHFGPGFNELEAGKKLPAIFGSIHNGWNRYTLNENLKLNLYAGPFSELKCEEIHSPVQFIFHDPFSPDTNPGLWTPAIFRFLREISSPNVILATYCAASSARAAMAVGGWFVARAPGALGKREMTLAALNPEQLTSHKRVNEERLKRRYNRGDFNRMKND